MSEVKEFTIRVDDQALDDLKRRLSQARFPDELKDAGWDLGIPLSEVKRLARYWQNDFDWKQCEDFKPLSVHFIHARSNVEGAIPLLFSHGWPGSFLEVTKILKPLTDGGKGHPAFHVIAPSLPNFGFSEGTEERGFNVHQYAETMHKLMLKLGYNEYVTQGGDWGWSLTRAMSLLYPDHCKATHLNMDVGQRPSYFKNPILALQYDFLPSTAREKHGVKRNEWFNEQGFGYNLLQGTKPQTIGYALADSPVALLAWVYEKLHDWSDAYPWTNDEFCTWMNIYWFSTAGPAASCRIYYERNNPAMGAIDQAKVEAWIPKVKIGLSHFPHEIRVLPSAWTRTQGNVVFEKDHESGGHFAAYEKPDEIVADLREMFGKRGGAYGVVKSI